MDTAIADTPELHLAIEAGIKDALSQVAKTAGDARGRCNPDQTIEGLVINMTLEIDKLTIGHDSDKAPTASIPLLPTLALLVKRMGVTRDAALDAIKGAMEEALTLDKGAASKLLEEVGVAEAEALIKEKVIATLPRTAVKKSAKAKGAKLSVTGVATKAG